MKLMNTKKFQKIIIQKLIEPIYLVKLSQKIF